MEFLSHFFPLYSNKVVQQCNQLLRTNDISGLGYQGKVIFILANQRLILE
jgi:hypothetical protein